MAKSSSVIGQMAVLGSCPGGFHKLLRQFNCKVTVHPFTALVEDFDTLRQARAVFLLAQEPGEPVLYRTMADNLRLLSEAGIGLYAEAIRTDGGSEFDAASLFGFTSDARVQASELARVVSVASHPATGLEPGYVLDEFNSSTVLGAVRENATAPLIFARVLGTERVLGSVPAGNDGWPALIICAPDADEDLGTVESSDDSPGGRCAYATFPLSRFAESGFRPTDLWRKLARSIIAFLARLQLPETDEPLAFRGGVVAQPGAAWQTRHGGHAPAVSRKSPQKERSLSKMDLREAAWQTVERNIRWFRRSGLLPRQDGSAGVWEAMQADTGAIRHGKRPDCMFQTAMAFYLHSKIAGDEDSRRTAQGILEYLLTPDFQLDDPQNITRGFWSWYGPVVPGQPSHIFVDDNAWAGLVSLYLYQETRDERLLLSGLKCAFSYLQIQDKQGLLPAHITAQELIEKGRLGFQESTLQPFTPASPHFGGMGAALLWAAFGLTNDHDYLIGARRLSDQLMARHPSYEGVYQVSHTQALARALFPAVLAAAYDMNDKTVDHLHSVDESLAKRQLPSGALQEWGNPRSDVFAVDTAVFHQDGERVADFLYTVNFALFNWQLAYALFGDDRYVTRLDPLVDFVARTQVADLDDRIDGGWMRAFHFGKWEWFGSNQDLGWGPYCMETGWTNAPITAALCLYLLGESFCPLPDATNVHAARVNEGIKAEFTW